MVARNVSRAGKFSQCTDFNDLLPMIAVGSPTEPEVHYTRTFLFAAEFLLRASAVTSLSGSSVENGPAA